MIRVGNPPYMECSSAGDKRFSAFYARPATLNGRSIEEAYQAMKILPGGITGLPPNRAKGIRAINAAECAKKYVEWWEDWVVEQGLEDVLLRASGLSDIFAKEGHVCQALVLWEIRRELGGEE